MAGIQYFAAVCVIKNSGKTTLLEKIVRTLTAYGYKVAVIKHDGHDFECDVPGTDSWRYITAGAFGAAIYSDRQVFVRKILPDKPKALVHTLMKCFPEVDVILAEGCKGLPVRKIEVVRSDVSHRPVSNPEGRFLMSLSSRRNTSARRRSPLRALRRSQI